MGPNEPSCYLHPHFAKYTPISCFWLISFRNITELYGLRDDACFKCSKVINQGPYTDNKCPQMKFGYDTHAWEKASKSASITGESPSDEF